MFNLFGKKAVQVASEAAAESFKEANEKLTENLTDIQKLAGNVVAVDKDLARAESNIVILTQAIQALEERIAALEEQLSINGIKFTNN